MRKALLIIALVYSVMASLPLSAQGWKWAVGSSSLGGYIESSLIATDGAGNLYETGTLIPETGYTGALAASFGSISVIDTGGGLLVSTDSNGRYRWVLPVENGTAGFMSVTTDAYGNIYLLGCCTGISFTFGSQAFAGGYGYFCTKIDSSGQVLWIKPMAQHAYMVTSMCVNSTGNIYIAGVFGSNLGGSRTFAIGASTLTNTDPSGMTNDIFLAKFDSSGAPLWAKSFGGTANDLQASLALTNDSEIYIAGNFLSDTMIIGSDTLAIAPGSSSPLYVAKFGISGNPLWGRSIPANDTFDHIASIATDPEGSVYITGNYGHHFSFAGDTLPVPIYFYMFLAKYDSAGHAKWGRALADQDFGRAYSNTADACGNIWVAGQSFNFSNNDQLFLAEYDSAGHLEDSFTAVAGGDDDVAIITDNQGNFYIGGDYEHIPTIIGRDTLTNTGTGEALFVLKYKYAPASCMPALNTTQPAALPTAQVTLFPNPAMEECTIQSNDAFPPGSWAAIYDVTGRLIHKYPLSGVNTVIPLSGFLPGIYSCRIYSNGFLVDTKKLAVIK